jgi:hypothetical protein
MLNLEQTKNDAINAYQEGNVMNNRGLRKKTCRIFIYGLFTMYGSLSVRHCGWRHPLLRMFSDMIRRS